MSDKGYEFPVLLVMSLTPNLNLKSDWRPRVLEKLHSLPSLVAEEVMLMSLLHSCEVQSQKDLDCLKVGQEATRLEDSGRNQL